VEVAASAPIAAAKESFYLKSASLSSACYFNNLASIRAKEKKTIVKGVSCTVEPGQLLAILGASGSGLFVKRGKGHRDIKTERQRDKGPPISLLCLSADEFICSIVEQQESRRSLTHWRAA
jgi:hypothetical protein